MLGGKNPDIAFAHPGYGRLTMRGRGRLGTIHKWKNSACAKVLGDLSRLYDEP
jgi:hypothetical protein